MTIQMKNGTTSSTTITCICQIDKITYQGKDRDMKENITLDIWGSEGYDYVDYSFL
jgi:hypothetical protein